MRQLSEECKMSLGHIGFYFGKKEDIMISICKIQLAKAYNVINECQDIPDEKLLKLLIYLIFTFYMVDRRNIVYRLVSDMSSNNEFLKWRTCVICEYLQEAYREYGIYINCKELSNVCSFFMHGMYGYIHEEYTCGNTVDYKKGFMLFIKTLLVHFDSAQCNRYIEKSLQLFERLNKEKLVSQLELELG